jgi:hypothetical protein
MNIPWYKLDKSIVPNLLAMCELAIFYILYKRSGISLAGQSLTLAIIKLYTDSSKDQANKVLYIKFYKYVGCMSIRKLPIKIVIYIVQ